VGSAKYSRIVNVIYGSAEGTELFKQCSHSQSFRRLSEASSRSTLNEAE
jgi:hypothetical protein